MKVQRYTKGATNVAELQSQADAVISPDEAAAAAMVPYEAVGDAAGAISQDLIRVDQNNKRLMAQEDAITVKMMAEEQKAAVLRRESNPEYENQVQPDGSMTAFKFLDDMESDIDAGRARLEEIQDPRTRANAEKIYALTSDVVRLEGRKFINDRREDWNAQGLYDLRGIQFEAQDWIAFRETNQELRDKGLITEPQFATANEAMQAKQMDVKTDFVLDEYEKAYQGGFGPEFYKALVNSDLPDDIKDAAIKKVENQQTNFTKIETKQRAVLEAEMLGDVTDMLIKIKTNKPLETSIEEFISKGMIAAGDDPKMQKKVLAWEKELRLAEISGVKGDGAYDEYIYKRTNGIYLDNTPTNQKNLDREIQNALVEGMTDEQMRQKSVDIQREAGYLSANTEEMFSTAKRNDQYLAGIAPLWGELMLNPDINRSMDTKVEADNQALLTDTYKDIKSGVPALEAAQANIEVHEKWISDKEVMTYRSTYYATENRGTEESTDAFETLIDDIYDATSFLTITATKGGTIALAADPTGQGEFTFEGLGRDAQARYENYFHDAFMQSNDMETAKMQADLQFTNLHNLNNLNGTWTVELNGVKGDVNPMRLDFINDNRSEEVVYSGTGGLTYSTIGDLDKVRFVNPVDTPNGKKYEVWTENVPVMKQVAKRVDGRTTVTNEQVYKTIETSALDQAQLERLRNETAKEVERLQSEYESAKRMDEFDSIYGREERAKTLRNVPNKIKFAQEHLERAEIRLGAE